MKNLSQWIVLLFWLGTGVVYAQPANDDCLGSQTVIDNGACIGGTTVLAADNWSGLVGCQTGAPNSVHEDVWYNFTATFSSLSIDVTAGAGWTGNLEVSLWLPDASGCAGLFTLVASNCGPSPVNLSTTGLTPGQQYFIVVSNEVSGTPGAFTICTETVAPPVSCTDNNDCSTAAVISLNPSGPPNGPSACITDCNTGASPGIDGVGNNCYDSPNPTVWYQFTTDAGAASLDISLTSAVLSDPEFTIWTNCPANTYIGASCTEGTGGSAVLTSLGISPSTTYYIAVSDVTGDQGDFTLCISQTLDQSLCNTGGLITETGSSNVASPVGGPYTAGEVVSFCYTIDPWEKLNCNWLQGIVPTFGDCWDPASFLPSGMPATVTTPLVVAGNESGTWNWYLPGAVTYNNIVGSLPPNSPMPAGWYFQCNTCGVSNADPDLSWGDGGAAGAPQNDCDINGNGYTWTVCFDLIAGDGSNCLGGQTDCSVTFKTYADGEIGGWSNTGCTGDLPDVYPASFLCCPVFDDPGPLAGCDNLTLPAITGALLSGYEQYWTGTGGTGTAYPAGTTFQYADFVSYPQTLFIYDTSACGIEVAVNFTIQQTPDVYVPANLSACDSVQLPAIAGVGLLNEAYYSGAGATGTQFGAGDWITTSGTYYVYDSTGAPSNCFDEESFTITITPTPVITNPGTLAACDSVQLPAINGTNLTVAVAYYDGPGGTGTQYAIGDWISTSGTYYIYDNTGAPNNCSDEESFTITVTLSPVITNPGTLTACDSIQLPSISGTNLSGNQAYYDGPGGTGTQYAVGQWISVAGTYYIYDNTGAPNFCFDDEAFSVNLTPSPIITNPGTLSACDSIQLPIINGANLTAGVAYYDGPGGTGTQYGIGDWISTSGTYYIYDNTGAPNNCSDQEIFTITINTPPVITLTPNHPGSCGANDGSITVNGAGTGTIVWSGTASGTSGVGQSLPYSITALTAGNYSVTFTDGTTGCISLPVATVLNNPGAPIINTMADTASCEVDYVIQDPATSITGVNLTGNQAYYSAPGGNVADLLPQGSIITAGMSPFTVYMYDNDGSCASEVSFIVNVNTNPTAAVTPDPIEYCVGSVVNLNGNPTGGSGVYTTNAWTGNVGILNATAIVNPSTINTAAAGVYSLTYTVTDNVGCVGSDGITVTIVAIPSITNPGTLTACDSVQLPAIGGANLSGGQSYYSGSGGTGTAYSSGDWITTSGTYYIYDNTGGLAMCSDEESFTITITATPVLTNPGPLTACDSVQLPAIGGANLSGNAAYFTGAGGTGTQYAAGDWITSGGTYYLFDNTGAPNNCADEETFVITLTPSPIITNPGAQIACDSIQLPAIAGSNLSGNVAYFTSAGGTGTQYAAGDWLYASTTMYIYDDTGAPNNCTDEESFAVTVAPTPVITNPGTLTACDSLQLPAFAGANLTGSISYYTAAGGTGIALAPGSWLYSSTPIYIYDNTGAPTNCSDEEMFNVVINMTPTAIPNSFTSPICEGQDIELLGNTVAGASYQWTGPNAFTSALEDPIITSATIADSGTYSLQITLNGCTSPIETVEIVVIIGPVITPMSNVSACETYTLPSITGSNLSGNEAYYDNSQANGGLLITGAITSSQTVWIYDAVAQCASEESFVVTINPLPTVTSISGGGVYCQGDLVTDIVVEVTGAQPWTVDYTLNGTSMQMTGTTTPIVLGSVAGTYVLQSIDDANCSNSAVGSETIVINAIPQAPTAGTDSEYCSTVSFDELTATGNGGVFTWYSDAGLTNTIGTGTTLQPTNTVGQTVYYVTETLNGCEGPSSQVLITVNVCDIIIPSAFTPGTDNAHDDWEIYNLTEAYPNHVVRVYNRWGTMLYESPQGGYDTNRWDGTYKGELLPVASYYYIIEFNDEEKGAAQGTVSLIYNN